MSASRWNANRTRNLAQLAFSWARRQTVVPAPPIQVYVEPTNVCNYRCLYCSFSAPRYGRLAKGVMAPATFRAIVGRIRDEAPQAALTLALGGEPFLHPGLAELVRIANEFGFGAGIPSNGSLLTPERSRELAAPGLRYGLLIDFCADPAIYERERHLGSWETVRTNLQGYLDACRRTGRAPSLTIKDMSPVATPVAERAAALARLQALFPELPPDRFLVMNPHNWTGTVGAPTRGRYSVCTHPWSSLAINYAGEAMACCRDILFDYPTGSVLERPLLEVWNGPRMQALRRGLARRDLDELPTCRECDRPYRQGGLAAAPLREKVRAVYNLLHRR